MPELLNKTHNLPGTKRAIITYSDSVVELLILVDGVAQITRYMDSLDEAIAEANRLNVTRLELESWDK